MNLLIEFIMQNHYYINLLCKIKIKEYTFLFFWDLFCLGARAPPKSVKVEKYNLLYLWAS